MITQETALKTFQYADGSLYWKDARQKVKAGSKAGYLNPSTGYEVVFIDCKRYRTHRVIYLMFHGYLPKEIDHIDGDKTNNRIENLREASRTQNEFNKGLRKHNLLGISNVSKTKDNRYVVRFKENYKQIYAQTFDDLELAELVSIMAKEKYHGKYARI